MAEKVLNPAPDRFREKYKPVKTMKNQLTITLSSRQKGLRASLSDILHCCIILIQRIRLYMGEVCCCCCC